MVDMATPATAIKSMCAGGAGADEIENLDDHYRRIFLDARSRWDGNKPMQDSFTEWASNEAAHERRFSPQRFFEVRRWQDHVDDSGERETINNTHIPLFTRFLLEQHPDLKHWCELRRSHWDTLFAGGD